MASIKQTVGAVAESKTAFDGYASSLRVEWDVGRPGFVSGNGHYSPGDRVVFFWCGKSYLADGNLTTAEFAPPDKTIYGLYGILCAVFGVLSIFLVGLPFFILFRVLASVEKGALRAKAKAAFAELVASEGRAISAGDGRIREGA
jgi:hypothetical protein